jgi:hypothetical protein
MRETNRQMEVLLGRACAACLHPVAAWRQFSIKWRVVTVTAYATAGYVATFVALFALERV